MSGKEHVKRPSSQMDSDVREDYNRNVKTSHNASTSLDDGLPKRKKEKAGKSSTRKSRRANSTI